MPLLRKIHQCRSLMEQKNEFVKSKQADWDRVKIRSTQYLFCLKIAGLLENSYLKCALGDEFKALQIQLNRVLTL